jgi:hypothetical protein
MLFRKTENLLAPRLGGKQENDMRKYVCGSVWAKWDGKRCCMELRWWMKINVVGIKKIFILLNKIIFSTWILYIRGCMCCTNNNGSNNKSVLFLKDVSNLVSYSAIPQALRSGGFSVVFISFLPNGFTFYVFCLLLNNFFFF